MLNHRKSLPSYLKFIEFNPFSLPEDILYKFIALLYHSVYLSRSVANRFNLFQLQKVQLCLPLKPVIRELIRYQKKVNIDIYRIL